MIDAPKKKIKLYSRKQYTLNIPGDPKVPITWTDAVPAHFHLGTEVIRYVKGQPTVFVELADGTTEPLSELYVIPDRRAKARD